MPKTNILPTTRLNGEDLDRYKAFKLMEQPKVIAKRLVRDGKVKEATEFLTACEKYPLHYFCPTPEQEAVIEEFVRLASKNPTSYLLVQGGNGTGKSWLTCMLLAQVICGSQCGWFKGKVFESWPFPKLAWLGSTKNAITDTIVNYMKHLLPAGSYTIDKQGKTWDSKMIVSIPGRPEWEIVFKTYDQAPEEFESSNVGFIDLDEPALSQIWNACKSRIRDGGIIVMAQTPLKCPPYIYDEVIGKVNDGYKNWSHLHMSFLNTSADKSGRGFRTQELIDSTISGYAPEEYDARVYGEMGYYSGKIIPQFDQNKHQVVELWDKHANHGQVIYFQGVDPHDGRPPAVVWGALTADMKLHIIAEYPEDRSKPFWRFDKPVPIRAQVEAFREIEERFGIVNPIRVMDRHFGNQTKLGQYTVKQAYAIESQAIGYPIYFEDSASSGSGEGELIFGHNIMRNMFESDRVTIMGNIYHVVNGLNHYVYEHRTGKAASVKTELSPKPAELYKDMNDAVRYMMVRVSQVTSEMLLPRVQPMEERQTNDYDDLMFGGVC